MDELNGVSRIRDDGQGAEDYFIPFLCSTNAVFLLVLFAQLVAIILTLTGSSLSQFDWGWCGLVSLMCHWITLVSAGLICTLRRWLMTLSVAVSALIAYVVVLAVAASVSMVTFWLLVDVSGGQGAYRYEHWVDGLTPVAITGVITGVVFRYFLLQADLRAKQQSYLVARLNGLQARMHPHFLFNTLNAIASLIPVDPANAERAIEDLSALMRANLRDLDTLGSVEQEIELCEGYLRIERLRLGDRLKVNWDVDPAVLECSIPPLLLQPLLENAIKHGVQQVRDCPEPIWVALKAFGADLRIRVANGVPDQGSAHDTGHKMALKNVSDRLDALFGEGSNIDVIEENGVFCVSIHFKGMIKESDNAHESSGV